MRRIAAPPARRDFKARCASPLGRKTAPTCVPRGRYAPYPRRGQGSPAARLGDHSIWAAAAGSGDCTEPVGLQTCSRSSGWRVATSAPSSRRHARRVTCGQPRFRRRLFSHSDRNHGDRHPAQPGVSAGRAHRPTCESLKRTPRRDVESLAGNNSSRSGNVTQSRSPRLQHRRAGTTRERLEHPPSIAIRKMWRELWKPFPEGFTACV